MIKMLIETKNVGLLNLRLLLQPNWNEVKSYKYTMRLNIGAVATFIMINKKIRLLLSAILLT